MTWMFDWLSTNATAVQAVAAAITAVGSVSGIFTAIYIAGRQTRVARRDREDARRRAARVLAMQLLPTVKSIDEDLEKLVNLNRSNTGPDIIHRVQHGLMKPDLLKILESLLRRLKVLDEETVKPVLGLLEELRAYERSRSEANLLWHLTNKSELVDGKLAQLQKLAEAASPYAAEAVKRLEKVAKD
jgi:hypothetical protein